MIDWIPIKELPVEEIANKKKVLIKTNKGVISAWLHIDNDSDEYFDEWYCYEDAIILDFGDKDITHFAYFDE